MFKKLLILFAPVFLLTACSNQVDLAIDNPSSEPITCYVDSLYVEVPGQEVVWVEMGKGEHTITLDNDSVINYNFTQPVYMINPGLNQYLMYEEIYGTAAIASSIPNQKVNFLGLEIEGNWVLVEDVVNEVKWDYGPRESTPEMIEIEEGDRPAVMKLMDAREVLSQLMGGYGDEEGAEDEMPVSEEAPISE